MSGPPVVRPATVADASRIAALGEVLGYPASPETMAGRLERLLRREDDVVLVAVDGGGAIVGWIHGAEREGVEFGPRCEILGLVVDGARRGHGVGRALVAAVEAWAAARGLADMAVRSNVTRAESHPFYERLGFVRAKTQHSYRKRLGPREQV